MRGGGHVLECRVSDVSETDEAELFIMFFLVSGSYTASSIISGRAFNDQTPRSQTHC